MAKSPISKLSEEQKKQIYRAVQRMAEDMFYDVQASAEACGEKLTNIGFIDGICDRMYDNEWAGQKLMDDETLAIWKSIPHGAKVRWLNLECRYV